MNNRFVLSGCGTALVTPFRNGDVDYKAYATLVERQVKAGIHFLVPLGSTAETPCLEDDEKQKLLELTREIAGDRTILAGVGTNSLKQTIRNMRLLNEADMFLVVVPYYNKPTARGQYEYFKAVASETDKPVVLYNVPGRTGTDMKAETTLKLAEIENIVAIKEASGNLGQIKEIILGAPDGFSVLSGNDDQTVDIMKMGGAGVISVASNIAPGLLVKMTEAASEGNFKEADALNARLMPLFENCFIESNPIPVKAGLSAMGLMENELRLPLTSCEDSTYDIMVKTINDLKYE
ncbi:MAG: 4-hydroxy-tetrahydrodipicolinate synthase [Bacteroidales bacterium]|nr:4-hydroxy-tetrahydrodipicolinate synthase [Bacteroides sp.]MCM1198821.1 4-hydroxy-tetrahydrodipicolinate synthase [Clostridium sp.]MCM1501260.1 4-hydroxy-tetrahydrodipicolinate synthase [Bacteroidales bacterium]